MRFSVWALVARLVIPRCSSLVHQFPITCSSRDRLKSIAGTLLKQKSPCLFLLMVGKASAQWPVIDSTNIAQSIINSSNNIVHTSSTALNMINNFKETVNIYEQGKKYYDALKSVNNLVKDARKVQQTILMVGDITDIYINNYQKMMHDDNFSVEELSAIGFGYTKLLVFLLIYQVQLDS